MKMKLSDLVHIIKEELQNIREAPAVEDAQDDKKKKEDKGEKKKLAPHKVSAQDKDGDDEIPSPEKSGHQHEPPKDLDKKPKEQPTPEQPEDDELEKDAENPEDVTGGEIAKELTGKRIQSLTMEPKSKILPGAQEIVVTFADIPDPLKILVTKTGSVKFFFKTLHNKL